MSVTFHRSLCLPLLLFICAESSAPLRAQSPGAPDPVEAEKAMLMPVIQPPLALFRGLLTMTPAQREKRLTDWPPEKRARLLAKIHEYEAMTSAARERVLAATELHWYMQQFLQNTSTNRALQLSQVPKSYTNKIKETLAQWDILPPPLQQEVLAHETTREYFMVGSHARTNASLPIIPPPLRQELTRLESLAPEQRRQTYANFQRFFELSPAGKQEILNSLPVIERQQVEATLAGLDRLPREQRNLGLKSLGQLAGLTDEQLREFFSNASRWKQLSPAEQQTWLKLVSHLPPLPRSTAPVPSLTAVANPSR